jgi:hypothetical protein
MSHATSSKFVPLPSPPPENSKLGVLLVAVNVAVSFLCLLRDLVILPDVGVGCEPCCRANGHPFGANGLLIELPIGWNGHVSVQIGLVRWLFERPLGTVASPVSRSSSLTTHCRYT